MAGKTTFASLMNNKKSKDRIFAKAKAQVKGGGLLDLIPSVGLDGKSLEAEKGWTALGRPPKKQEIDSSTSPTEMLLRGKAILKDGRRVRWTE